MHLLELSWWKAKSRAMKLNKAVWYNVQRRSILPFIYKWDNPILKMERKKWVSPKFPSPLLLRKLLKRSARRKWFLPVNRTLMKSKVLFFFLWPQGIVCLYYIEVVVVWNRPHCPSSAGGGARVFWNILGSGGPESGGNTRALLKGFDTVFLGGCVSDCFCARDEGD